MKHLVILAAERIIEQNLPVRMSKYRSGEASDAPESKPCGTAGCFAGWLPYVGIPEFEIDREYFTWDNYIYAKLQLTPVEFRWLFAASWPDSPHFNLVRAKMLIGLDTNELSRLIDLFHTDYAQLIETCEEAQPELMAKARQEAQL